MTVATALVHADVATRLPAQDLDRARRWYAEKLGLDPVEERPGGLRYQCGTTYFVVFQSTGKASGESTQMAWEVDDIEAVVADLESRGVEFEDGRLAGHEDRERHRRHRRELPVEGSR